MTRNRGLLVVGSAVAVLTAGYAIRRLLHREDIQHWLKERLARQDGRSVDDALEDTFPASDPPSFTATTSLGARR